MTKTAVMTKTAITLAVAIMGAPANAQLSPIKPMAEQVFPTPGQPAVPAAVSGDDVTTLKAIHRDNINEIAMGQLAQEQGALVSTKAYGKSLVTEHALADQKVLAFCARMNIDPAQLGDPLPNHNHPELEGRAGSEWDHAFADMMFTDHKNAVDMVESARKQTANPKVAAFLTELLPTLVKHQGIAKKISMQISSVAKKP